MGNRELGRRSVSVGISLITIQIIVSYLTSQYLQRIGWLTKLVTCTALGMGWMPKIVAQSNGVSTTPEICEIDFNLLKSEPSSDRFTSADPAPKQKHKAQPTQGGAEIGGEPAHVSPNIITADTVSAKGMTLPSLWWTSEQFPAKLVTNWIADRDQKQVYLLVNARYWNLLDYIDRYRTIDQFGRVAQGYGYNLKLCSSQKIVLARYSCNEIDSPKERLSQQASCQIWLNATGQDGMGVQGK